jgi:hydrogenase large subunit
MTARKKPQLVEMAWDPITRGVGSMGIHTKIDFNNRQVAECYITSSIFRGYSVLLRDKDPRDAHFITSRICGICGDNHAICACYAQNMFDHNLYQDNLVGVDFCEQMVKETNPGVLAKAQTTRSPHASLHGYRKELQVRHVPAYGGQPLVGGSRDD